MDRQPIFDAVHRLLGRDLTRSEVDALDAAFDRALTEDAAAFPTRAVRSLGEAGRVLVKRWEACGALRSNGRFEAYPDPGSADGKPWTIGWGSTGPDIGKGTVWTQAQCDARLEKDLAACADEVARAIGDCATGRNQFDALVSFHYNTGQIGSATLTKLHRLGRHAEARAEFGKWIHNNGKVLRGLVRRRAEEAKLYGKPDQ